jgi:hypothetical protein
MFLKGHNKKLIFTMSAESKARRREKVFEFDTLNPVLRIRDVLSWNPDPNIFSSRITNPT